MNYETGNKWFFSKYLIGFIHFFFMRKCMQTQKDMLSKVEINYIAAAKPDPVGVKIFKLHINFHVASHHR